MISVEEFLRQGAGAEVHASAPGRVNLLGEHTDYNDGFVLPIAIPQTTRVALRRSDDDAFHVHAASLGETADFRHGEELPEGFARYVEGCLRVLEEQGVQVPPLTMHVRSDVPMGAGLSSSAALEVAVLRAVRRLLGLGIDDVQIALLAQQAEIRYAGVQCGIMDQMASSLADTEHMLFLDTRTLDRRLLPLPAGAALVVIDSGVSRTLAGSAYNQRRDECREAARLLGVESLRDVTDPARLDALPPLLQRRARHVVTENARVLQAAAGVGAETFGDLMNASHASLKDDYEVSIPALDRLCDLLRADPQVYGARLTGAGFGGACVALCRDGSAARVAAQTVERFNGDAPGGSATVLLPARNA